MDIRVKTSIEVLNYIISDLGLENAKQFSEKLGFKRPERLYKILRGDVSISRNLADKINEIYPQYDKNSILSGSMLKDQTVNEPELEYKTEVLTNTNGNKFKENSDGSFTITTKLVPFEAYASYVKTLESEVARIDEWEEVSFNVKQYGRGNYLGFRSKGESMNGGSLNDTPTDALMLGRELGRQLWLDGFRKTDYGFVIVSKYSIMHKDITALNKETGEITCHSRNNSPEHQDFNLNLNDVYQIFKVIKRTF